MSHVGKELRKNLRVRKKVESLLYQLKDSFVIVEGKHDVKALEFFGITAYTFEKIMRTVKFHESKAILLMDNDRRGIEKMELLSNKLSSEDVIIDNTTGRSLLKMLNAVHVEGIRAPIEQLFEIGK